MDFQVLDFGVLLVLLAFKHFVNQKLLKQQGQCPEQETQRHVD